MFIHVPRVVVFPVHTLIIGLLVSPANTPTGVLKPPAGLMDSLAVKFKFMKNQNPNWRYFIVAGAVLAALGIWPLLAGKIQISLVAEVVALACVLTGLAIHFANCRRGKNRQPTHPTEASFKLSALLALLLGVQAGAHAQGTAFTYQGRLNFNGSPAAGNYDFRFRLATDALGNNFTGSPFLTNAVPVTNGLFFTTLDFGAGIFTGGNLWLQIEVKTNGAAGYSLLNPLQAFAPTPYAMFANTASNVSGTISAAQISGTIGNSVLPASPNFSGTITANAIAGNGANVTNVNAATLNGLNAANFWKLGGNAISPGQFLGSTNNQPVEIWVNNLRALRLEPNNTSPNVIGGFAGNYVAPSVYGATIGGGGGAFGYTNKVTDSMGAIGGGQGNSEGAFGATIAGGNGNEVDANAINSAIGGGWHNLIQGSSDILAYSGYGTIGGGQANTISSNAPGATIPGGVANFAGGAGAFAAGQQAQALHQGAFVWADSQGAPWASTGTNQFLVRAGGGVGINVTNPAYNLDVGGRIRLRQETGGSTAGLWLYQNGPASDRAFIGMDGDGYVGFYGNSGSGWGLTMNINNNCIAMGNLTTASGIGSMAMGGITTASGSYSTAMGVGTTASGNTSTAMGAGSIAGGINSTAMGVNSQASNNFAFVWSDGFLNYQSSNYFSSTAPGQFLIHAGGGVGIGTNQPNAALEVASASALPQLRLDQQLNDFSRIRLAGYTNAYWDIAVQKTMNFFCSSNGLNVLVLNPNGSAVFAGTVTANGVLLTSDRNAKENFTPLNPKAVLAKVVALPVTEWNYKSDDQAQKHIGPMAQDFQAAFQLSADDKHISVVDEGGVALAAIQGLNEKLESENASLQSQLAALKSLLEQLAQARQK